MKYSEFNFLSFYNEMFVSSLHSNWAELTDFSFYKFFANLKNNINEFLTFLKLIDLVIPDEGFVLTILQFMKNQLGVVDQKSILQQIVLKIDNQYEITQLLFLKLKEFYDFVYCGGNKIQVNKWRLSNAQKEVSKMEGNFIFRRLL